MRFPALLCCLFVTLCAIGGCFAPPRQLQATGSAAVLGGASGDAGPPPDSGAQVTVYVAPGGACGPLTCDAGAFCVSCGPGIADAGPGSIRWSCYTPPAGVIPAPNCQDCVNNPGCGGDPCGWPANSCICTGPVDLDAGTIECING